MASAAALDGLRDALSVCRFRGPLRALRTTKTALPYTSARFAYMVLQSGYKLVCVW